MKELGSNIHTVSVCVYICTVCIYIYCVYIYKALYKRPYYEVLKIIILFSFANKIFNDNDLHKETAINIFIALKVINIRPLK